MRKVSLFAVVYLALAACVTPPGAGHFSALAGQWQGAGTFQGMPSRVQANFARDRQGDWGLEIEILATPAKGEPIRFTGKARYQMRGREPVGGSWSDSMGSDYTISPRFVAGALIVAWGPEALARARSEYRILADGRLQIDDFAPASNGELRRFANATLQRVANKDR